MKATNQTLHQAGVIAYRILDGKLQVLLVTSRETGRWIIPRGNIDSGATPAEAAEKEAYEEAGLKGTIIGPIPLGSYRYVKILASGKKRPATVEVFLLRVQQQLKKWPEMHERKLVWVSIKKAVRLIQEPRAIPLLLRLNELENDVLNAERELSSEPHGITN